MFTKLIELKESYTLKSLNIKFNGPCIVFPQKKCSKLVSLLTKLTEITSIKSIAISPLSLSKPDSEYLKFWFNRPFGECIVPEFYKKGRIIENKQNVCVVKY